MFLFNFGLPDVDGTIPSLLQKQIFYSSLFSKTKHEPKSFI